MKNLLLFLCFLLSHPIFAKVLKVEITSRESVLNGKTFSEYGEYELLKGKIYYGFDPSNIHNQNITDIELAPRNAEGLVTAWGDLAVLQPKHLFKSKGTALVEVSNRGGKFSPSYFNQATKGRELVANDPAYWGDGLLMEQGLTVIWIGWQFDVPTDEHILKLHVPYAINSDGSAIKGMVRSDWTVDKKVEVLGLGHRAQTGYPAINLESYKHQLTVRDGRDAPRLLVPRNQWQFAILDKDGKVQTDASHIYLKGGFQEGKIYELVYESQNPAIVGLGIAAIRDVIAYAKYDSTCPFPVKKGIAAGVSQTGRFLRTMLYHNLNTDEQGRKAYDGMMIITAGAGRGSFNHRFGQPSRDAHRYSAFFYPTDIFPFSSRVQKDTGLGIEDGLLAETKDTPKIFYINTGYEYWGRSASLIHTSVNSVLDIKPLSFERIYHIASGQHFVDRFPPRESFRMSGERIYRGNPLQFKPNYRALLVQLVNWVTDDTTPPNSRYPTNAKKTLTTKENLNFPNIPGFETPTTIHNAYRVDYGKDWKNGIVNFQPPLLGYSFLMQVPQVDEVGNELGGISNIEIQVPLATYTGWNLRHGYKGGSHELTDFRGSFAPFPIINAEKIAKNDPRPSIESLYNNKENYLQKVDSVAKTLVADGFLLERDMDFVKDEAAKKWDWVTAPTPPLVTSEGPKNGSLMIIGGGKLDKLFFEKFKELAGGEKSKIVIIPTASEDRWLDQKDFKKRLKKSFEEADLSNITILHTRNPEEANTEKFIQPLKEASGVWITGGRQWRLMDAYANTRTLEELKKLLDRGGVIAGSSAGATIQGSYLARGDTKTNTIMMGDHEEGFGFISNVSIDQHLLARNRHFDNFEILEKHPELLGIGLDENVGLLIQGNTAEVIGKSYVAIYDGKMWWRDKNEFFELPKGSKEFYFLKSGDKYNLAERKVILD